MKGNPVLYKTLVVGVIVLFIGVGIQPAFAVDVSNRINKNRDNLGDFEQLPYGPDESWIFRISDADAGYRVWDEYWELDDAISNTHWWGLSLVHPWTNCNPEGMVFEIIFWDQLLGNPVCTYHITPYEMPTGIYYNRAEMYQWEIELDPCCMQIPDGWISIQSIQSPNNCWFHWAGSGDGDLYCYHEGATNPDCESDCAFKFQMYNPVYGKIYCDPIGMDFRRARPGTTVTGQIYICNCGYPGSYLDWYVDTEAVPAWGTWTFTPASGTGVAEGDCILIDVTCVLTDEMGEYSGAITIYNADDLKDFCEIDSSVEVTRTRSSSYLWFEWLLERFPLLERLLDWIRYS